MTPQLLSRRHPWLLLGAALLGVGLWLGWGLWHEHARIERDEFARLNTQARVIEDNLTRQLGTIQQSLVSIQAAMPGWQSRATGASDALQMLAGMASAMTSVRTFLVTNAQGTVIYSNREELLGRNFFQRDYLQTPLKTLNPNVLYVSTPFKSVLNNYLINLSRVMLDANGRFSGVISAAIDPVDFDILVNSVRYSDDMQAALVHANGQTFILQPTSPQTLEKIQPAWGDSFERHLRSGQPVSEFNTAGTQPQLQVMHTVSPQQLTIDKPVVVVLSRTQAELFPAWQRDVIMQLLAYVLLVVVSVLGLAAFERQRAQKIMTAKRLKLATDASGVGIWEFDLVTRQYQWDEVMFALFGLRPDAASPRNDDWIKLLPADDLKRMHDATRATIKQDQPFNMTFQIKRPDGQVRYMRNRAALYSDDQGVPRRLIGATEDVTQQKQQEADLRVAAAAFESHESMLIANAQVETVRVNQAFSALFGYSASEVVGQNPRLLKSDRHDADFYTAMWTELLQHHSWQGEVWNTRKNGQTFPCWLCITAVCDESGTVTHFVATHTDITLRKAAEDEVKRLAFFDPLTQLPNRRLLTDRLHQAVAKAKRDQGQLALIFVDLDRFKPVNDRHGHAAGDQLLQAVAHRLRNCVRESDTVARVGGDEFVVLQGSVHQSADATRVAEKIHASLREPFHLPMGQSVQISSSIGVAMYPEHGLDEASLSHHADVAMYAAKAAGRDQFVFYSPSLDQPAAAVPAPGQVGQANEP
ncbi:diguanylate cyclase [Rhodoferax sp.]|uniref:sensor domain-containing diguanylate cyclase n=1 Tax=Rhodoferax sp. TaxID=50421 RepID=UPI00260BC76C|nr:diguanylate cyclase [Rhodoferax sp.]MDD5480069.1 diguanylate cyclase [Rhodoferax sp.]